MRSGMLFLAAVAASISLAACALQGAGADDAEIQISFGPAASRELDTGWTGGTVPAFSSVTVTVSARDMKPVSRTVSGSERSIGVRVPTGRNRLVEISAVPASGFVSSYYGSETVDLRYGTSSRLAIQIELSETGILLPDALGGVLSDAMSVSGPRSAGGFKKTIGEYDDFEFDDRGRVYLSSSTGIGRLGSLSSRSLERIALSLAVSKGIAYDPASSRAYYISSQTVDELCFVDVSREVPASVLVSRPPNSGFLWGQCLAAGEGSVYACILPESMTDFRVARLSIGAPSGTMADFTEVDSAAFEDLGLTAPLAFSGNRYLRAEDMLLKDGILYILATDVYQGPDNYYGTLSTYYSRGKVVALSAANLEKLWETGWSGDDNAFPTEPGTQFYGPRRIVGIMPRKIFIADDGYSIIGNYGAQSSVNQDRVVGVDSLAGAITDIGLDGEASFFNDFDYFFAC